jgi:spore coat polysaccharide biosynthesis predicted glycosyltransferase SpsG
MRIAAIALAGGRFHTGHVSRMTTLLSQTHRFDAALLVVATNLYKLPISRFPDGVTVEIMQMDPDKPDEARIAQALTDFAPDVALFDCLDALPELKDSVAEHTRTVIFDDECFPQRKAHLTVNAIIGDWNRKHDELAGGRVLLQGPRFLIIRQRTDHSANSASPTAATCNAIEPPDEFVGVFVALGGTDPTRSTLPIVQALASIAAGADVGFDALHGRQLLALVLASPAHPDRLKLQLAASSFHCTVGYGIDAYPWLAQATLAITGGGLLAFEALHHGVPCLVVPNSNHEERTAALLAGRGLVLRRGPRLRLEPSQDSDYYAKAIASALSDTAKLKRVASRAASFIDGLGADRVWEWIEAMPAN